MPRSTSTGGNNNICSLLPLRLPIRLPLLLLQIFLHLSVLVVVVSVAGDTNTGTGNTNTCSLDPITWSSCPDSNPRLSIMYEEVTVKQCGQMYNKQLFTTLNSLSYNGTLAKEKTFTAVMVDPDAPGHGSGGLAWLHWIRAGLTSDSLEAGTMNTGKDIVAYNPPTPPQNTGVHRYFVFLFEERQTQTEAVQEGGEISRRKFDPAAYAQSQQMCGPVAVNMFKTEY